MVEPEKVLKTEKYVTLLAEQLKPKTKKKAKKPAEVGEGENPTAGIPGTPRILT